MENINITEQLNKFKKLINAKSGEVILEQTDGDVLRDTANKIQGDIRRATSGGMTNEDLLLSTIKQINSLKLYNAVNGLLKQNPIGGNSSIIDVLNDELGYDDVGVANEIKKSLESIGKYITFQTAGPNIITNSFRIVDTKTETPAAPASSLTERQKNINITFCSVKNGIIVNPSSYYNNTSWEDWKKTQKPTDAEIEVAKKSCPQRRRNPAKLRATVNDRFTKSAQSLGIQNGKMDVDTLQKILTSLEGGETKAKTANDFSPQGVPADAFNPQEVPDTNL